MRDRVIMAIMCLFSCAPSAMNRTFQRKSLRPSAKRSATSNAYDRNSSVAEFPILGINNFFQKAHFLLGSAIFLIRGAKESLRLHVLLLKQ